MGAKLAFTTTRGDHSLVAIFDAAANTLRYLDPSTDFDSDENVRCEEIPIDDGERIVRDLRPELFGVRPLIAPRPQRSACKNGCADCWPSPGSSATRAGW